MVGGVKKNIWIIANWKSNKTIAEALDWIAKVGPQVPKKDNLKVVVCPAFSCLSEINKTIQVNNFPLMLGSQDLSPFGIGAYTGEEPAQILNQLVGFSILGHSERRKNFSETDEMITKKVEQANSNKIIPLLCIQGKDVPVPQGCKLVAYEPVWAIGSGTPDTPDNDEEVAVFVKSNYGEDVEVLCGGSINSGNIREFISKPNISGALIGGASLEAEEFIEIIKICEELGL